MTTRTAPDAFRERLERIGFHFAPDQLVAARELVARRGFEPEELSDLALMTICVEAYGHPDRDLPAWI